MNQKLIFVYNANSSILNRIEDLFHKSLHPETYSCRLCALTYSGISKRKEWKEFIGSLPLESEFLHKDEFSKKYPQFSSHQLPAVFIQSNQGLKPLINTSQINQQENLGELKDLVSAKISKL